MGGIWNLSKPERSKRIPIPQTNPRYGHRPASQVANGPTNGNHSYDISLEFESPLYDYLETNIPKPLMAYSDKSFLDDLPLFPHHEDVLKYLEEYAEDVKHLIRFNHQVCNITLDSSSSQEVWQVEIEDLTSGITTSDRYDAVVIANGHYTVPSLPRINGIEAWNKSYPDTIIHSKAYRKPEDYTGQKVLVIGNSASGLDVAYQVSQHSRQPVLVSSRSASMFGMPPSSWRKDVGEVIEFLPSTTHTRAVRFQDGSIESDIDAIIFATGYFYSFPFLRDIEPPVVTDGLRMQDTYQHLFNISHPTLVFPVINLKVIPFPLSENQAAVVARVWSGRLTLPSPEKMRDWERHTIELKGSGKYFHVMKFPEDAAQINELYAWAKSASRREGLENDGQGRLGTRWGEREVWLRSRFPQIKMAHQGKGDERRKFKRVEELGFDYEEWRKSARVEEVQMFKAARC